MWPKSWLAEKIRRIKKNNREKEGKDMRRRKRWNPALVLFALLLFMWGGPIWAQGGPVVLMNIDAEEQNNATYNFHGGKGPYTSVLQDILNNVTNGGSGILVIGGGKSSTDTVTEFWNIIGGNVSQSVTFVNGATNITNQSFAGFAVIGVASNARTISSGSGLTRVENNALADRANDIADFVNGGGGILGFTQNNMRKNKYAYIGQIGGDVTTRGGNYSNVTETTAGAEVGITNTNLDVCCWHGTYRTFPSFLNVLAYRAGTSRAVAIGGAQVVVWAGDDQRRGRAR